MTKVIETEINGIRRRIMIRTSTDEDLDRIVSWLREEEEEGVDGNFLCNWNLPQQAHEDGELLVLLDETTLEPMGYQWGALLSPGILQIRNKYRRNGLGKILVEYCISKALKNNESILFIQCKPSSSIPFWKRMGFQLVGSSSGSAYAYQILQKKLNVPSDGKASMVHISGYPERKKWQHGTPALDEYSVNSVLTPDRIIHLSERISLFCRQNADVRDLVIGIEHGGKTLYLDKAKYQKARAIGVLPCRNGYFIERIQVDEC